MYGKTINGVLYVVDEPKDGYKPFTYTTAPVYHPLAQLVGLYVEVWTG